MIDQLIFPQERPEADVKNQTPNKHVSLPDVEVVELFEKYLSLD